MTIQRVKPGAKIDRANWSTPSWLFSHYQDRFDFTLDAAAEKWNAKCEEYITREQDAIVTPWSGRVWLNCPYSNIAPFVRVAYEQTRLARNVEVVALLLPVRTSTLWFHEHVLPFAEIEWLTARVCFEPPVGYSGKKDSPAEDSLVAIFERPWMPRGKRAQRSIGP